MKNDLAIPNYEGSFIMPLNLQFRYGGICFIGSGSGNLAWKKLSVKILYLHDVDIKV